VAGLIPSHLKTHRQPGMMVTGEVVCESKGKNHRSASQPVDHCNSLESFVKSPSGNKHVNQPTTLEPSTQQVAQDERSKPVPPSLQLSASTTDLLGNYQ